MRLRRPPPYDHRTADATASLNGITISRTDLGDRDSPALLLVHDHPFDRSMWGPQKGPAKAAASR
ncbi:hypothetical protein ABH941_007565 [Streptacidiphilus sp. EB103A]